MRKTGRRQNILIDRLAVDHEFNRERDPRAGAVVWPPLGARQLGELLGGQPAAIGEARPAVLQGELDLRLALGNLIIDRTRRQKAHEPDDGGKKNALAEERERARARSWRARDGVAHVLVRRGG